MHLFFLSISVYTRPSTPNFETSNVEMLTERSVSKNDANSSDEESEDEEMDIKTVVRYCSEVATLIGVLCYLVFQQGDEIKNQGFSGFVKQLVHAPAQGIFLISNIMILACIPFRIMGDIDTEEAILVFAVPGSWFLLMFFAGLVKASFAQYESKFILLSVLYD